MSAAALCTHDGTGDFFTMVNDRIAGLAPFWRVAAQAAWNAIVGFLEANKTELTISNAVLLTSKWLEGYGLSFLSKGLYALQHLLGVIERETRSNRRKISFTARLRGSVREPATATQGAKKESSAHPPAAPQNVSPPGPKVAQELLARTRAKGWDLEVLEGGKLQWRKIRPDAEDLSQDLLRQAKINKEHLLDLISANRPARE